MAEDVQLPTTIRVLEHAGNAALVELTQLVFQKEEELSEREIHGIEARRWQHFQEAMSNIYDALLQEDYQPSPPHVGRQVLEGRPTFCWRILIYNRDTNHRMVQFIKQSCNKDMLFID